MAVTLKDVAVWMPDGETVNKANLVRFDVAVHATEARQGEGRLKIAVAQLDGGMSKEQTAISRIQFDIPLIIAEHPFPAKRQPKGAPLVSS